MNKYQIGQTLYWFKYQENKPELMSVGVGCIKQTKDGYKYGTGQVGATFISEKILFETVEGAVSYGCAVLKGFLITVEGR